MVLVVRLVTVLNVCQVCVHGKNAQEVTGSYTGADPVILRATPLTTPTYCGHTLHPHAGHAPAPAIHTTP